MSRTPGERVGNRPRQLVLQVRCHVLEGFSQLPDSFNTVGDVVAQDFERCALGRDKLPHQKQEGIHIEVKWAKATHPME